MGYVVFGKEQLGGGAHYKRGFGLIPCGYFYPYRKLHEFNKYEHFRRTRAGRHKAENICWRFALSE